MKKSLMRKYAKLIAVVGANIQKKQAVIINAAVDQSEFVTILVDECYKAGASRVSIDWGCQAVDKLHYRHQSLKNLSTVLPWKEEKLKQMVKDMPARIYIFSDDPEGMKGVNIEKMQKVRQAQYPIIKPYSDAIEYHTQWTIAAVPSKAWAKKVFPDLRPAAAVEKLWQNILATVHVTEDNDPVAAWKEHNDNFAARCKWLNEHHFDRIVYKSSNGTDFTAWLMKQSKWNGGCDKTLEGVVFNPNLPTEEIFTTPMKGKAEGKLVSTMPLSNNGKMINNFSVTFRNGKAVEWDAEEGKDVLGRLITMDETSSMLGELALVPMSSPIGQSGILYYETLFDENASCHVALGAGFNDCVEGYENLTNEECTELGVNDSMIHVDFMIGAPDLCITGYKGRKATPIFVNGEWADLK